MSKKIVLPILLFVIAGLFAGFVLFNQSKSNKIKETESVVKDEDVLKGEVKRNKGLENEEENRQEQEQKKLSSMAIEELQKANFPGGDFNIEEELANGSNYKQYVVSYESEGLKIRGLLTEPLSPIPEDGYPGVVFVHGYIPPKQYSTVESYPTYQAALARAGFVTFKPDLRGHGQSEGEPASAHFSEKYLLDTLSAVAYLKKHDKVNSEKIGYWGHSNGGEIGLNAAVVNSDIKAYSLWAGVVGSYEDMLETYNEDIPFLQEKDHPVIQENGLPSENNNFWKKIDAHYYLDNVSAPIQLQHGSEDTSVPIELSLSLKNKLEGANKEVEFFEYKGDDHNISLNSDIAWQRTIDFFRENL
ncbi:MAG: alpha/beta fold hydrolase [Candidatus Moraniibacteriota bacterium]